MGKVRWCIRFDKEINDDFSAIHSNDCVCESCVGCIFEVFETPNEIRARKALEAGRNQSNLFHVLKKSEEKKIKKENEKNHFGNDFGND